MSLEIQCGKWEGAHTRREIGEWPPAPKLPVFHCSRLRKPTFLQPALYLSRLDTIPPARDSDDSASVPLAMLKRQRPSSPVFFPEEVDAAATDLYEPDSKRRRYFASPSFPSVGKQSIAQASDADSDDGDERDNAWSEYSARKPEWHMAAGAYKDANTLLHDLHAEQRHRALFSPSYRPSSSNASHNAYSSPYLHPRPTLESGKDHTSPLSDPSTGLPLNHPLPPATYTTPSHSDGTQMGYDGTVESTDHSEAEMVTQRYEGSNRFLRALFLSRRREIEGHDQIQ